MEPAIARLLTEHQETVLVLPSWRIFPAASATASEGARMWGMEEAVPKARLVGAELAQRGNGRDDRQLVTRRGNVLRRREEIRHLAAPQLHDGDLVARADRRHRVAAQPVAGAHFQPL